MDHLITVRDYSELKLENMRLRNELEAQKQMYERVLNDFKTVLNDTNNIYTKEIQRLNALIGKDKSSIPSPVIPPAINPPTTTRTQKEKPSRSQNGVTHVVKSNCIQEHTKRQPRAQPIIQFTETSLRKSVLSSLQKNKLEELFMFTLAPRFTEDNIHLVFEALYTAMHQSLSLLKSFDETEITKRVEIFSSLLFFISTRFPESSILDNCLQKIQEELLNELSQAHVSTKTDRFSNSYLALFLVYYDLCRYFDVLEMFKPLLYNIFIKAGEFPLRLIYLLYKHDPAVFREESLCDSVINCIIGETLSLHSKQLQDYHELLLYFSSMKRDFTTELESFESSSLQFILDSEQYTMENPSFIEAGRTLVLLYVYRGGLYAINSLIGNGILQNVEDSQLSSDYRVFLIYLLLWIAETNLFGNEWLRIKDLISSHELFSDKIKADFPHLFSIYESLLNQTRKNTEKLPVVPAI